MKYLRSTLHYVKSVPIRSFFWSVFSRIRTEYGEIRSISPYSVQMRENTDQKNSVFGHFSRIVNNGRSSYVYKNLKTITCDLTEVIRSNNQKSCQRSKSSSYTPIIVNYKLLTNFKNQVNSFNSVFSKQGQPIPNNNTLHQVRHLKLPID